MPAYRQRALFFKLAAAYEAEEYDTGERAYLALLESRGSCFSDCMFLAASTKLALANDAKKAVPEQDRYRAQAVALMKNLRERFPEYETSRLQERIALYKDDEAKNRMRAHQKELAQALSAH